MLFDTYFPGKEAHSGIFPPSCRHTGKIKIPISYITFLLSDMTILRHRRGIPFFIIQVISTHPIIQSPGMKIAISLSGYPVHAKPVVFKKVSLKFSGDRASKYYFFMTSCHRMVTGQGTDTKGLFLSIWKRENLKKKKELLMKTLNIVMSMLLLMTAGVWAQLTVKNNSGDVLMRVDQTSGDAVVTLGSSGVPGHLITETITITDGAGAGKVLTSDTDGNASWGSVSITESDPQWSANDNDHTIGNEFPLGGNAITISADRTVNHANTSSQSSVNNSGRMVIQDISVDGYGHITGINSTTLADNTEDNQPLSEVLTDGNDAGGRNAMNFGRIAVGTSSLDSRIRVDGSVTSTLPIFGDYNTGVYATDYNSSDNENQVVIEGIGTVQSSDNNKAHLGVQGMLLGGTNNDVWIASASLGYHNTNYGNTVAAISANVREVDGYVPSADLQTAVFSGENTNTGSSHYGLKVEAEKHHLKGHLLVEGKVGINIGDREPATWFEINGQPYINANNAGIMMKSSNGQCWQIRVNDSGNLTTTARDCP